MNKNIIRFFSWLFIKQNVYIGKVREIRRQLRCPHIHRDNGVILMWNISSFLLHFAFFLKLVLGHMKASNQFLLASLFSWVSYRTISRHQNILVSLCFSVFTSLVHYKLFSTSQPRGVWRKVRAHSGMMSSSCIYTIFPLSGLHSSLLVIWYSRHAHKFSWSHLPPTCCTWTQLLLTCHPHNLHGTSTGEQPVYFRRKEHFLLCHECKLCDMSISITNSVFLQRLKNLVYPTIYS